MPSACAATIGRVCSNAPSVAERRASACVAVRPLARAFSSLRSSRRRHPAGGRAGCGSPRSCSSAVCEARQPSFSSLRTSSQARRAARNHEQRLAGVAQLGVHGGVDHVHVRDAAVADAHLVAVDDPVVAVARARWSAGWPRRCRPGARRSPARRASGRPARRSTAGAQRSS